MEKTSAEAKEKLFDLIKDIKVPLLVTQNAQGELSARPMWAIEIKEFDGELWFYTSRNSPKIAEIQSNSNVLLSYSEPSDQNYVSVRGIAQVIEDRAKIKQYWSEYLRTWFPEGSDDPNIVMIHFQAESAEYWDAPSSTFVHMYGYVKARLTGERPKGGENEKVDLRKSA